MKSVEIQLLGQKIFLKTAESDPTLIAEVAELVSGKIREAEARCSKANIAAHQVALLALMDLGVDYAKAKRATSEFKKEIESKSGHLVNLIEAQLGSSELQQA